MGVAGKVILFFIHLVPLSTMEEGRFSPPAVRVITASISGIVGCGKTTAIKRLRKTGLLKAALPLNVHLSFVREPSRLWQERGWLAKFYGDPSHNAAAFQFQVFTTYVEAVERTLKEDPCPPGCDTHLLIVERSMFDQRLFWKKQCASGMKTADDNYDEAYTLVWSRWREFIPEVNIIFLFQTSDINTTMRRVQARARAEEMGASFSSAEDQPLNASCAGLLNTEAAPIQQVGGLTLAYQEQLHRMHREWFTEPRAHPLGCTDPRGIRCVHVSADDAYHVNDGSLLRLAQLLAGHIVEEMKQ